MNSEQKMREALERIKASLWVDDPYGHFDIVCEALAAPAGEQVGLTKREIDGLLKECIDVLHCHQRNMQKDLLTRLRAARRTIAAHKAKRNGGAA